jgi:hypothetical protein
MPNGSKASITYLAGMELLIRVKEANGPIWKGNVKIVDYSRGSLTFKYEGRKYEYRYKACYLGLDVLEGKQFDYFILVGDGVNYGTELVRCELKRHC